MIPKISENPKGLHQRYIVAKSNGQPIDPKAEYFVLRLDDNGNDPIHINACREAVITYAEKIQKHLPELGQDLINRYGFERLALSDVNSSFYCDNTEEEGMLSCGEQCIFCKNKT